MSMTEVVEESLKADARFRHLTVMRPDFYKNMLYKVECGHYYEDGIYDD